MIEDGMRLQIDVTDKDFSILDQLSDKMIMYKDGVYVQDTLTHITVVTHLRNLSERLMKARVKQSRVFRKGHASKGLSIVENQHSQAVFSTTTGTAEMEDDRLITYSKFDKTTVVNTLAYVVGVLCRSGNTVLDPRRSVVRELADMKLLTFKDTQNGNVLVVHKDNVFGNVLNNVLYNRIVFEYLYVDLHPEENLVYIFNNEFEEVCTLPYDKSFDVYFVADDNVFESEG